MSRGPGAVQRAVLQFLWNRRAELRPELWIKVQEIPLEPVMPESIRRAVHGLSGLGLVDIRVEKVRVDWTGTSSNWFGFVAFVFSETYRPVLFTRIALAPEEAAEAAVLREEFKQHQQLDPQFRIQGAELSPDQSGAIAWCDWYRQPEWEQFGDSPLQRYDLDGEYGPLPIPRP